MSNVTNLVLLMSILEDVSWDDDPVSIPPFDRLNEWLRERHSEFVRVEDVTPLHKMTGYVAVAAVNHLDREGFLELFRSAGWQEPVQLMLADENDDRYIEYRAGEET